MQYFFLKLRLTCLPLAAVGDFGELHCQPSTNVDARQNVQLTTEPAFAKPMCLLHNSNIQKFV